MDKTENNSGLRRTHNTGYYNTLHLNVLYAPKMHKKETTVMDMLLSIE